MSIQNLFVPNKYNLFDGSLTFKELSTAERNDLSVVDGLMIYDAVVHAFFFRQNGVWIQLQGSYYPTAAIYAVRYYASGQFTSIADASSATLFNGNGGTSGGNNGITNNPSSTSNFTIITAGKYLVTCNIIYGPSSPGPDTDLKVSINKNGSSTASNFAASLLELIHSNSISVTTILDCAAADVISATLTNSSGGGTDLTATEGSRLVITYIGT